MSKSVGSRKPLVKSSSIRDIPLDQRSLIIFHSAIKSEVTRKNYDLSLDQSVRLKLELEKKNNQLSSLEVKDRRIEQLENVLSRLEINMNELNSKI